VRFHPEPLALCPLERRLDRLLWMSGSQLYPIRCELATHSRDRVCGRLSAGGRRLSTSLAVIPVIGMTSNLRRAWDGRRWRAVRGARGCCLCERFPRLRDSFVKEVAHRVHKRSSAAVTTSTAAPVAVARALAQSPAHRDDRGCRASAQQTSRRSSARSPARPCRNPSPGSRSPQSTRSRCCRPRCYAASTEAGSTGTGLPVVSVS